MSTSSRIANHDRQGAAVCNGAPGVNAAWLVDLIKLIHTQFSQGDTDQILMVVLRHITEGFGATSGSLAILDGTSSELVIRAATDLPQEIIGRRVPLGHGIVGQVVLRGEAMVLNGTLTDAQREGERRSAIPDSAICWPLIGQKGTIGGLCLNRDASYPPFDSACIEHGQVFVDTIGLMVENVQLHLDHLRQIDQLAGMNHDIQAMNHQLEQVHQQLLQQEKLAAIGQLAAGVAHEINNPVGYVHSNLSTLDRYVGDLFRVLDTYGEIDIQAMGQPETAAKLAAVFRSVDVPFLRDDLASLIQESQEGVTRVKQIVQDLRNFSHVDEGSWQWANLEKGLDSTLNIVWNELKYKSEVVKAYAGIPEVECMPSQLNQVFMNLLVNAGQAIEERGTITVRTGLEGMDHVWVEVEDTGKGIEPEHQSRIFDPFFTTKPVGKGTGLGLSLSYGIVQKHNGTITVDSHPGTGTCFRITLPIAQESGCADEPDALHKGQATTGAR